MGLFRKSLKDKRLGSEYADPDTKCRDIENAYGHEPTIEACNKYAKAYKKSKYKTACSNYWYGENCARRFQ